MKRLRDAWAVLVGRKRVVDDEFAEFDTSSSEVGRLIGGKPLLSMGGGMFSPGLTIYDTAPTWTWTSPIRDDAARRCRPSNVPPTTQTNESPA